MLLNSIRADLWLTSITFIHVYDHQIAYRDVSWQNACRSTIGVAFFNRHLNKLSAELLWLTEDTSTGDEDSLNFRVQWDISM